VKDGRDATRRSRTAGLGLARPCAGTCGDGTEAAVMARDTSSASGCVEGENGQSWDTASRPASHGLDKWTPWWPRCRRVAVPGLLAGRRGSAGRGVRPCVRAKSPRSSLSPPRRPPCIRTPGLRRFATWPARPGRVSARTGRGDSGVAPACIPCARLQTVQTPKSDN
jgi:hypothetical protein